MWSTSYLVATYFVWNDKKKTLTPHNWLNLHELRTNYFHEFQTINRVFFSFFFEICSSTFWIAYVLKPPHAAISHHSLYLNRVVVNAVYVLNLHTLYFIWIRPLKGNFIFQYISTVGVTYKAFEDQRCQLLYIYMCWYCYTLHFILGIIHFTHLSSHTLNQQHSTLRRHRALSLSPSSL